MEYAHLLENQKRLAHDLQLLYQALESFTEISKIFDEQLRMHSETVDRAQTLDRST